jgi:electron transfer flavoprotein alpha/beta subunit
MKIAVAFAVDGDDAATAYALSVAASLAPAAALQGVCATGASAAATKTCAARIGIERAAILCHPALADTGERVRGAALAALSRHVGADLVLFGVPAAEDTFGLFPAAVAHTLKVPGAFRVGTIAADPDHADAVLATLRLAGKLRRLRVRLPAVLSLLPQPVKPRPVAARAVQVTTYDLAQLGLDTATLPEDPNAAATRTALQRKPATIGDVATLLTRR